jgi:hypothetical protein
LGWGFLWDVLVSRGKRVWAIGLLLLWLFGQGGLNACRLSRLRGVNPIEVIAAGLQSESLESAWANHWVATALWHFSGEKYACVSYDASPISQKAWRCVRKLDRVGLVWVDGLDQPEELPRVKKSFENVGYRSGRVWRYKSGWALYEFFRTPPRPVSRKNQ